MPMSMLNMPRRESKITSGLRMECDLDFRFRTWIESATGNGPAPGRHTRNRRSKIRNSKSKIKQLPFCNRTCVRQPFAPMPDAAHSLEADPVLGPRPGRAVKYRGTSLLQMRRKPDVGKTRTAASPRGGSRELDFAVSPPTRGPAEGLTSPPQQQASRLAKRPSGPLQGVWGAAPPRCG